MTGGRGRAAVQARLPRIRWCYLGARPGSLHALVEDDRRAVCGRTPPWRREGAYWRGHNNAAEHALLAGAVRCARCVGVLKSRVDRQLRQDQGAAADGRPGWLPGEYHELYDWFAANGVHEWLPDHLIATTRGGQLTFTAFRWVGDRGFDADNIRLPVDDQDPVTEPRTVPLSVPVTSRLRALAEILDFQLLEGGGR